MGRPRIDTIPSQDMHCAKHGLTEHRQYVKRGSVIQWQCMLCNRERAAKQQGVDMHFEQCFIHGLSEHRTYQHADGYKRTLCVACQKEKNKIAAAVRREQEKAEKALSARPVCPSCFLQLSACGTCGCDE